MCKAFSCIVRKNGTVVWKAGVDSHDTLLESAKIKDDTTDPEAITFARVEITPTDGNYLYPEKPWTLNVDGVRPSWWLPAKHEPKALAAHESWKVEIYKGFDYQGLRNLKSPLVGEAIKPTSKDMELLGGAASVWASVWASVRDSVRDSVWDSVRASVRDSVWASVRDSVWAKTGASFPRITVWRYAPKTDDYPYQPYVDLWDRGFIPTFDGKLWRLHSGAKAEIVWQGTIEQLKEQTK